MSTGERTRIAVGMGAGGLAAGAVALIAIGALLGIIPVPIGTFGESLTHDYYGAVFGLFLIILAAGAAMIGVLAAGSGVVLLLVAGVLAFVVFRRKGTAAP